MTEKINSVYRIGTFGRVQGLSIVNYESLLRTDYNKIKNCLVGQD